MPRQAREKSPYGIYHVILRGNGKKTIFDDDDDCRMFLHLLAKAKTELNFKLYAYCLMGNHVHLLIREGEDGMEIIFRKVATGYAIYYNAKYDFTGHLFQGRYKSEIIDSERYFLSALRYICLNPVKAGLCTHLPEYPWVGCSSLWSRGMETDRVKELGDMSKESLEAFLNGECSKDHIEYDDASRMTDAAAIRVFCEVNQCSNPQEIIGWSRKRQEEAIRKAGKAGIHKTQMSRITGMTRYFIEKRI